MAVRCHRRCSAAPIADTLGPSSPRSCRALRARAWYSGPCLRGSAYSFGLSVQYVPDVVPYHDAPPQSGSNVSGSTSSYDVEPSVAFFGRRCPDRRRRARDRSRPGRPRSSGSVGSGDDLRPRTGSRSGSRPRPAAVRAMGGAGAVRVGLLGSSGGARPAASDRAWSRPIRTGDLVVGRLDGEEPRQRRLTGGVRVVRLGEPSIGALDLVEGRPSLEAERAVRIGSGPSVGALLARARVRRPAEGRRRQPISSPTGASSNSGIDSAPTRPCGSRMVGRW